MTDGICVLYIDDDAALRDLTAELLERSNPEIAVRCESDPTMVPPKLSSNEFDCIVTDYNMPQMDGLELCNRIREEDPSLPLFLFTNNDDRAVIEEALEVGVTDYIQKATGIERYKLLANRITNAVDHHRDQTQLAELKSTR